MSNPPKKFWPDTSFLPGLELKSYNGVRETDDHQRLANLRLAPLDGAISEFIKWLNAMGKDEYIWWQSIGWGEGYRYFATASATGQEYYFKNLKRDRDERIPQLIKQY